MRLGKKIAIVCLLIGLGACDSSDSIPDAGAANRSLVRIDPPHPDVGLTPGSQQVLSVQYLDAHQIGIEHAQIHFAIYGDPRGSTLSTDSATTDDDGMASVQVRAGAVTSRFQVRVSASGAKDVTYYIEVSDAGFGSLLVAASYSGAVPHEDLTRVTFSLFGDIGCSSIDLSDPPPFLRSRVTDSVDRQVPFQALPLNLNHTLTALAYDQQDKDVWRLRAVGCVEIPIGVLRAARPLSFNILLEDLRPQLAGTYAIVSTLLLPEVNRPLADALTPWMDLTDCELDPAQFLLDCIIDAMDPADPLDCMISSPSAKAQALIEERGVPVNGCRSVTSPRGTPSLEHLIATSMEISGTQVLSALGLVAASAVEILSNLKVLSTLDILGVDTDGSAVIAHQLEAVTFYGEAEQTTYDVASVGLPLRLARPIRGQLEVESESLKLSLAQHGFSLRYGLLSRQALGDLVLSPAGLPASSSALAIQLTELVPAASDPQVASGCDAIDQLVCKAARLDQGCLAAACLDGTNAVASFLDEGFEQMDALPRDLLLQGEVMLFDDDGDLRIDRLGSEKLPGAWSARLTLGPGIPQTLLLLQAHFLGERQ